MSIIDKLKNKFNEMFPDESDPAVKPERLIPYDVHVKMPNGTIKEISAFRCLTEFCVKTPQSPYYHTAMSCPDVQEAERFGRPIEASAFKGKKCPECEEIENREDDDDSTL